MTALAAGINAADVRTSALDPPRTTTSTTGTKAPAGRGPTPRAAS